MCKILIFGGTTEGRILAEFCGRERIPAFVSVTSGYGRELLKENPYLKVHDTAMDADEMSAFIRRHQTELVIDATHPYALEASRNVKKACEDTGTRYLRCIRAIAEGSGEGMIRVSSPEEALRFLETQEGNVLVTTGSKELPVFCRDAKMRSRIFARVLPSAEILKSCAGLGIEKSHIIGMQGPFSEELNIALIRQVKAQFLVTKETGAAGGYEEKLRAAKHCGIPAVVIGCQRETEGAGVERCCQEIRRYYRSTGNLHITLAGIGPGHRSGMTQAVVEAIKSSETLFGAPRVLEAAKQALMALEGNENVRELIPRYLPEDVERWLKEQETLSPDKSVKEAVILFSGDPGFYSGAKKMTTMLRAKGIACSVEPGISSLSFFAARLGTGWEDAEICSAHGRDFELAKALGRGTKKLFLLTGGDNGAGKLCRRLCGAGYGKVRITVGENLSYPEERILTGTAESLSAEQFASLSLMLIENVTEEETYER